MSCRRTMRAAARIVAFLAVVATPNALASGLHPDAGPSDPEQQLIRALDLFRHGDVQGALDDVQRLVAAEPNFRLAQLVYGDLLASRTGAPISLDEHSAVPRESVDLLMAEARQRWRRHEFDPTGRLPAPLLQLAQSQAHVLLVDTASSRLFVFENHDGAPELIADYYVSAGKNGVRKEREGDRRTPLGVYTLNGRRTHSLPERYGPIAFPVDYPNAWDRRHGRSGAGIWLHGVSRGTFSRPPLDSDGCITMSNADLLAIAPLLDPGRTPVIIGEGVPWLTEDEAATRRDAVKASVEQWRTDWESGRYDRYISHYADDFRGRGMNRTQWIAYRKKDGSNESSIGISDLSIYAYPDEQDLFEVSFEQSYRNDRFNSTLHKLQYWRRDADGAWRIVSEEVG